MKLYKGTMLNNEIKIKEIIFNRETDKRYYIDNTKTSAYVDKYKINRYDDYGTYSDNKHMVISIIKNHYIEENKRLQKEIDRNKIIIENADKLQEKEC